MPTGRIVMRPMHDWRPPGVVYHFTAHFDAIAGLHGEARSDADIVDDFDRARARLRVKRLMFTLGTSA